MTTTKTMSSDGNREIVQKGGENAVDRIERIGRLCATIFMAALAVLFVYAYLGQFLFG